MGAEHPRRRNRTARELAERMGASIRTIQRIIAEPREDYENRAKQRRERIIELRKKGWTYKDIAEEVGMTTSGVSVTIQELRKNGINPRKEIDLAAVRREEIRAFHDDQNHTWKQTAERFGISERTACRWAYQARADRAAQVSSAPAAEPDKRYLRERIP